MSNIISIPGKIARLFFCGVSFLFKKLVYLSGKKPALPGSLTYRSIDVPSTGSSLSITMNDGVVLELRITLWKTFLSLIELERTFSIQFIDGLWSVVWGIAFTFLGRDMYTLSPIFYHWMKFLSPEVWGALWIIKGISQVYAVLLLYRSQCLYFESSTSPFHIKSQRACYVIAQVSLWYSFFIACGFLLDMHGLSLHAFCYIFWVLIDIWCLRSLINK